jgi:hypothetical protein
MGGMGPGIMALTAVISIFGTTAEGHTIPTTWNEVAEDHRRLPTSHPLLPLLEFRTRNPNPITPSPRFQVYPANYNGIFKNSERLVNLSTRAAF